MTLPPTPGLAAIVVLDVAAVLATARIAGAAARRLGQPTVAGEIVAGVVLGPSVLGALGEPGLSDRLFPATARPALDALGRVGLAAYMFVVGLELDRAAVRRGGRAVATVAVGATVVPLLAGLLVAPVLHRPPWIAAGAAPTGAGFGLMVGALLAVTALPVMARIVEERSLGDSPAAVVGVAAAAVTTPVMFLLVATARDVAGGRGAGAIGGRWLAAAAVCALVAVGARGALTALGRQATAARPGAVTVTAGAAAVTAAACLATERVGLGIVPGAVLAGVAAPAPAALRQLVAPARTVAVTVLLPVFLATSGLATDLTLLRPPMVAGIVLLLAAAVAGKWVGGALGARAGGMARRDAHVIGVLVNCRGLLVLVVGLAAVEAGVFSPAMQVGAVVVALATTFATAPLLARTGHQPDVDNQEERSWS